jgi:Uma2 family endonuclease
MATARSSITDEELLRLPRNGNKYEVVDGELRMSPAGLLHERIVARLIAQLGAFVRSKRIGDVLGSNVLYVLPSGNKRAPDVSFLAAGRLESAGDAVFPQLVPDLAIEVLSPNDSQRHVLDKVGEYLEAGVRLVWVVDPAPRRVAVYRSLTDVRHIDDTGTLEGENVIPEFRCTLSDLLD